MKVGGILIELVFRNIFRNGAPKAFVFSEFSVSFHFPEYFFYELGVILVDDGEILRDVHVCDIQRPDMVQGFVNIRLAEAHEVPR